MLGRELVLAQTPSGLLMSHWPFWTVHLPQLLVASCLQGGLSVVWSLFGNCSLFSYALVTVLMTHCNLFKIICAKFPHFYTVGSTLIIELQQIHVFRFKLIWTLHENKNLHYNMYNITSNSFWINQRVLLWCWRFFVTFCEISKTKLLVCLNFSPSNFDVMLWRRL